VHHSFDGCIYAVALNEDSVVSSAKPGTLIAMFADSPREVPLPAIECVHGLPGASRRSIATPARALCHSNALR
jgi:hypothetical protein